MSAQQEVQKASLKSADTAQKGSALSRVPVMNLCHDAIKPTC